MAISWTALKAKELTLRYTPAYGNYYIFASTDDVEYTCVLRAGSVDGVDFYENHRESATSLT
jgi:hypothetical protein